MKKILTLTIICLMTAAGAAFGINIQSFAFNDGVGTPDSGIYNPGDSFSFDVTLTFSGYNSPGLSYWFETSPAAAPFFSITGFTYGTEFTFLTQPPAFPAGFTFPIPDGMLADQYDLGALEADTTHSAVPGSYLVGHITFTVSGSATPSTYLLQTTTLSPKSSEVTSTDFMDNFIPAAFYTVTVAGTSSVPDAGGTFLLMLGSVVPLLVLRRTRVDG